MSQTSIAQLDFSYGISRDSAPHEIDPRAVYDAQNLLYEKDGSAFRRGGSEAASSSFGATGLTFLWDGYFDAGHRTVIANSSDFGVLPSTFTPGTGPTHAAVRLASTANLALSGTGVLTIDGVAASNGDRILLKNQTSAPANGIYTFAQVGTGGLPWTLTRAADMDSNGEVAQYMGVPVTEGSTLGGTSWYLNTAGPYTLGSTSLSFLQATSVLNLGSDGLPYPKLAAMLEGQLFIGGGYIYGGSRKTANYSTGTVSTTFGSKTVTGSGTTWNTLVDAGMLFQIGNGNVYVIASVDSTTQVTLRDAYGGATAAGQAYTFSPIYAITTADPYPDSEFYTVCANRLVYSTDGKTLGFSEIQRADKQTVTIEGVEVPNEHEMPEGGRIIGASTVGQSTLIFTTAGTWVLEGLAFNIVDAQGNPQHRMQLVSREMLLWGVTGIASWQQAQVVPALDGIYIMDGVRQPQRVSHGIDQLYRLYIEKGYRLGRATVFRGHYFLPILTAAGSAIKDMLVSRLDRPVRSGGQVVFPWSRFAGSGGSLSALAMSASDSGAEPMLLGAEALSTSRVVDCCAFFEPDAEHKNDADGTTFAWVLVTRDYETGGLTMNKVRNIKTRAELVGDEGDNPEIDFDYGFGRRDEGGYLWDVFDWADESATLDPDDLYWEDDFDDVYLSLNCPAPESNGLDRHRCRVNQDARYIRFRLRCDDPCASLRLRGFEVYTRPSQATRR